MPYAWPMIFLLAACIAHPTIVDKSDSGAGDGASDADGDGFGADDCDDADGSVNPDAIEICNGLDDDCDGVIDEDLQTTTFSDADGDGFGDATTPHDACEGAEGRVTNNEDCDDLNADVSPAGTEVCNEFDDNCDGAIDEGVTNAFYADADADAYGDAAGIVSACSMPEGYVADDTDCDDANATANPAGSEVCDLADNDCDGAVDEGVTRIWYVDLDGDSFGVPDSVQDACAQPTGYAASADDCDDADASINPDAIEVCDGVDQDCDTMVDDGFDSDGDTTPDCADEERCDGFDNDGDGLVDEADAVDATTWAIDYDGDGFGSGRYTITQCDAPSGYVANTEDCDDTDASINPGAAESCNGADDDCDGAADDGLTVSTWYIDRDGDLYGDAATALTDCAAPVGYVVADGDCDDLDNTVHPAASESCNGLDDDCDGTTDNGLGVTTWYADADSDTFGNASVSTSDCAAPAGYVATDGDCDDSDASVQVCTSCLDVLDAGSSVGDGVYSIDPCGTGAADYYCDMTTDGGGWTVAGWQASNGTQPLGVSDWGTVGSGDWSTDLACVPYDEIMVSNETYALRYRDTYSASTFSETAGEFTIGASTDAFVQGWYGPGTLTMACVNFNATYGAPAYGCDNDWAGGQQGHVTDYAGEFCSGGRLDSSWAWSTGTGCLYRGDAYTWSWALR